MPALSVNGTSSANYGTLILVSEVAPMSQTNAKAKASDDTNAKSRTIRQEQDHHASKGVGASAMKRSKSHDGAVKRSKSKERVAFTPPAVSNLESVQSASGTAQSYPKLESGKVDRQGATILSGTSLPAGSQNGMTTTAHGSIQTKLKQNGQSLPVNGLLHPQNAKGATSSMTITPSTTKIPAQPLTPVPAKVDTSTPSTPSRTILKRELQPANNGTAPTTASSPLQPKSTPRDFSTYLAALQSARSDPLSYLERHPMFHGRKAKALTYDYVGSTSGKSVVRVKIENTVVSQSAAAGSDSKLAKARAAFKAIEALCVSLKKL